MKNEDEKHEKGKTKFKGKQTRIMKKKQMKNVRQRKTREKEKT